MLQRAIDGKYCSYPVIESDPFFYSLRGEPGFQAIREAGIACQREFVAQN
jgi:hypothetical protein